MRALGAWAAALVSVTLSASTVSAQAPLPGFVGNGSYTTISTLGVDVDAFRNRTFAQVLAEVQALGPDWRLATIAEVTGPRSGSATTTRTCRCRT